MIILESAGITDVGRRRKGNEDSFFVDNDLKLYVVADGMGGHQAGEVASKLVVDTIREYMKRFKAGEILEELKDVDESLSKQSNRLLASIHLANRVVNEIANSKQAYKGMGSTVSAVSFHNDNLIAANVGDSPIYLIRDNSIELLSTPHTVIAEQIAMDPEAAKQLGPEYSHMLTRAMGTNETVEPDICEIQCFKGDIVVISSDGLSDKVSPPEILEIAKKEQPEILVKKLVDLANERGGEDNITVIALSLKKVKRNRWGIFNFFSRVMGR
ncbi:MAG: serine/threonine-protein phosphatase [Desulfobacterales bacterium]|nr:serine/threonine-protein phosphatase [Desulfobacterales bacterium]MBF0395693.1 serine/threonine-protein phosphatase [Desulfobacterales bacterium]